MRHATIAAAALTFGSLIVAAPAEAKGCIKGAVVGGATGSMAGQGEAGAAAGCAIGHHEANKKDKQGGQEQQGKPQGQ